MLRTLKITPDANAIKQLAMHIWEVAVNTQQRPLVLMSTAGPALALRRELELSRPPNMPLSLAFLPEIHGVNQWLEKTKGLLDVPAAVNSLARWEKVYNALEDWPRIREQLGGIGFGGRWSLAKAIVQACDKLSASSLFPIYEEPDEVEELLEKAQILFEKALEEAYPSISGQMLDIDAKLVMAFWKNLSSLSDPIPRRQLAYQLRAREACQPLVWVELAAPTHYEFQLSTDFLERYAQKFPVVSLSFDWTNVALWQESIEGDELTAEDKTKQIKVNRLAAKSENWQILGLKRFEDVAWKAAKNIEQHLIEGRQNIALVAQDRLVARRVRALLARLGPGLSIQDETGWKLVTTRAAAAVHSWLAIVKSSNGPTVMELMAFFKSPLFDIDFFDQVAGTLPDQIGKVNKESRAQNLLWEIERNLLGQDVKAGWTSIIACFEEGDQVDASNLDPNFSSNIYKANNCRSILIYLHRLSMAWHGPKKTAALWVDHLIEDLNQLGVKDALMSDEAGRQYLLCIESMSNLELSKLSLNSWLALLDLWIEDSAYLEKPAPGIAKVTILPLSGMRLRSFDAVVMVGCDDKHLPSFSDSGLFFSEQLMSALNIRGIQEEYMQQSRDLSQMLISHQFVDLIWQTSGSAQAENRPSSWLVRLDKDLELSQGSLLSLPLSKGYSVECPQSQAVWDRNKYPLPSSISPSAYKLLRDCPYRFYVKRLLGLRLLDGLDSESDSSLIGKLLHRVLRNFYHGVRSADIQQDLDLQNLTKQQREERYQFLQNKLEENSEKAFSKLIQSNAKYLSYWLDWHAQIPSWVEWQLHRESLGWQFHNAEVKVGFDLELDQDVQVRIEGFVDRLDINPKLGASVIDYKFQSHKKIEEKSSYILDDPQLLIYAKAVNKAMEVEEQSVNSVEWVALKQEKSNFKKGRTKYDFPLENYEELRETFIKGVARDLNDVWMGLPMKASAPDGICQYCEVRGICRKGMWSDSK